MNNRKASVGKPLAISLLITLVFTVAAYLVIQFYYDAHVAEALALGDPVGGVSIMTLSPSTAVMTGIWFAILLVIHWALSKIFIRGRAEPSWIADAMLWIAGASLILWLFERGAMDFRSFSLFCNVNEPIAVRLIDEVHRCERAMVVSDLLGCVSLSLVVLAIPVRVFQSKTKNPKA